MDYIWIICYFSDRNEVKQKSLSNVTINRIQQEFESPLYQIKGSTLNFKVILLLFLTSHARSFLFFHSIFRLFAATQTTKTENSCACSWSCVRFLLSHLEWVQFLFATTSWTTSLFESSTGESTPAACFLTSNWRRILHWCFFLKWKNLENTKQKFC